MKNKIEGYWYSEYEKQYPKPIPNTIDISIKQQFIEKLKKIQLHAHEVAYMGSSKCRLCDICNGSTEFNHKGWIWPIGYLHYIETHNVSPSKDFINFVINIKV